MASPNYHSISPHPQSKGATITKLVLRSLIISLSFILLITALTTSIARSNRLWFPVPSGVASLVYSTAELAVLWVNFNTAYGIHPAASLSFDLVLWLATGCCMGFLITIGWDNDYVGYGSWISGSTLVIVCIVLMCLIGCLHFGLFVRACIEVSRLNKAMKMARNPPIPEMGLQYAVQDVQRRSFEEMPPQVPSPDYDMRPQDATHKEVIPGKVLLRD